MTELEHLYRTHAAGLLGYLRRHFAGVEAAEDLLQETFVQALRGLDRLTAAASPRAWLFAIARNVGLAALRRRRHAASLPESLAAPAAREGDPRIEVAEQAMRRLPDGQREALELRLGDGLSYEEVAEVLAIPVGTVRSRLHHAMRRLRRELADVDE